MEVKLGVDVVLDVAVAHAILRQAAGNAEGAASLVDQALSAAPPGNAGWLLPIEPLLGVDRAHAGWARVLARLQRRAA